MFRILLATFAVSFVLASNASAQCPLLFPPIMRTRVTVVHKHYAVAPMVAVQAAPVIEAPAAEIVAPAPAVTYYRTAPVFSAPLAGVVSVDVSTGAQARHARKAAHHSAKAVWHTARAAYWASRS